MKILNGALSALAATTLVAAPVAAQAAPARTSTPAQGEQLAGFGWGWVFAAAVLIGVILIVVSDEDEDLPHSP